MKKLTNGDRLQYVMSHKADLVTEYTTKSGQKKNRYRYSVLPTVVKTIVHQKQK